MWGKEPLYSIALEGLKTARERSPDEEKAHQSKVVSVLLRRIDILKVKSVNHKDSWSKYFPTHRLWHGSKLSHPYIRDSNSVTGRYTRREISVVR